MADINKYIFKDKGYTDIRPFSLLTATLSPDESITDTPDANTLDVYYSAKGCGDIEQTGNNRHLPSRQLIIFSENKPIILTNQSSEDWVILRLSFTCSKKETLAPYMAKPLEYKKNTLSELAGGIYRYDAAEEYAISKIFELLAFLTDKKSSKLTDKNYAERVCDYVDSSYMNRLSVSEIADELSLNRHYLTRIFKQTKNMSIQQYIIDIRMEKAIELLRDGYSVTETANAVGYGDPFTFSRMFTKKYGKSPNNFRNK